MEASKYNATVYTFDEAGGLLSVGAGRLEDGCLVACAGLRCAALEGTEAYERLYLAETSAAQVQVVPDGAHGYRAALHGLRLPPAYLAEVGS